MQFFVKLDFVEKIIRRKFVAIFRKSKSLTRNETKRKAKVKVE